MTDTADKTRIITLTHQQPVQIREALWPQISSAEWHDGGPAFHQANRKQWLIIRQHADGRVLVYGGMDSLMPAERDVRAGELLWPGDPVVPAIRRVAADLSGESLPDLAPAAIRDLPAVDVDAIRPPVCPVASSALSE